MSMDRKFDEGALQLVPEGGYYRPVRVPPKYQWIVDVLVLEFGADMVRLSVPELAPAPAVHTEQRVGLYWVSRDESVEIGCGLLLQRDIKIPVLLVARMIESFRAQATAKGVTLP